MKKMFIRLSALLVLPIWFLASASLAQDNGPIHMPLPKGAEAYGAIDGKHLWQYVVEQAKIATDYRDKGNQFWGHIDGTSADDESAQWLLGKYRQIGLADAHAQPIQYLRPQFRPRPWTVTLSGAGKTIKLDSAQPAYNSAGTNGPVDLELVYIGLGSEADFAGKDVRGKAVLLAKEQGDFNWDRYHNFDPDLITRVMSHGPAAIFGFDFRGGNHHIQAYPTTATVPTFDLGTEDGKAARDLIAASAGTPPRLKFNLDVEWAANQKSWLVWGTLPGASDETIYVVAHRDGWFEGSGDNASGVATLLGLAEHFAKIPQAQRKRTLIFIGTDGHHQAGTYGQTWLAANRAKFFSKTALMINAEHPAEALPHQYYGGYTTAIVPNEWYAGGDSRPQLQKLAADAFRDFGVPVYGKPSKTGAGGDMGTYRGFLPGVAVESNDFPAMHTDMDSPEAVSWVGLEAMTRAYARLIDDVNKLPLSDLQRPEDASAIRPIDPLFCAAWIADSAKSCPP